MTEEEQGVEETTSFIGKARDLAHRYLGEILIVIVCVTVALVLSAYKDETSNVKPHPNEQLLKQLNSMSVVMHNMEVDLESVVKKHQDLTVPLKQLMSDPLLARSDFVCDEDTDVLIDMSNHRIVRINSEPVSCDYVFEQGLKTLSE